MNKKYNKKNGCIYNEKLDGEFVESEYTDMPQPIGGVWDENSGKWVIDNEKKLKDEWNINRSGIQDEFKKLDWMTIRHLQQVESGTFTSLTSEQFTELLSYANGLRLYSNEEIQQLPERPEFIK